MSLAQLWCPMPSAIEITFDQLNFDTSSKGRANDAFEAAAGCSRADSRPCCRAGKRFFNASEGQTEAAAVGTSILGNTITVSLAGLTPGTQANLVLRLVNNDGDTQTSVHVTRVQVNATPGALPPEQFGPAGLAATRRDIGLASLADVTPSFTPQYAQTSFDEDSQVLRASVSLHNVGSYSVHTPLIVAIRNLSDPAIRVRDVAGITPDGMPFYDLTDLVDGGTLSPGRHRDRPAFNPGRTPSPMTSIPGHQPPAVFTSTPGTEILAGQTVHDADAAIATAIRWPSRSFRADGIHQFRHGEISLRRPGQS